MRAAADTLDVRPYVPEDRPRLLDLLQQVWSYKCDVDRHVAERWWWQSDPAPIMVVDNLASRVLVGLCAYMPCTLTGSGREASCAWFVDFYVRAEYQGRGLGKRLTRAVEDRFAVTASLSQTAMAYRVFQKLGWSDRSAVQVLMHPWARRWMFPGVPAGLRIETAAIGTTLPESSSLDSLWFRARDRYPLIARRTSADLFRRYSAQPHRGYILIRAGRGQDCVGYMIVRTVRSRSGRSVAPAGLVVDWLVDPDDRETFGALLGEAASVLTADGCNRLWCATTVAAQSEMLRSSGFLASDTPLLGRALKGNTKWLTWVATPEAAWVKSAEWYLTLGDCDIDYAWYVD